MEVCGPEYSRRVSTASRENDRVVRSAGDPSGAQSEDIVLLVERGDLLDILEHPNPSVTRPSASSLSNARTIDRETRMFLDRVIGQSDAELTVEDFRIRDMALLDLVQRVQLEVGKADVSMVANFNQTTRVPMGDIRVRDIAGLYMYDNTLVVLEVTGQQLREALEYSARFFDGGIPEYNYDQAEGVSYGLDITKPVGQRIQNLTFRGTPIGPAQRLRLATNNYRVNGGGGYTMYRGARELYRSSKEIRELIIEWVEQHKKIPGEPTNNWRVVAP